MKKLFTGLVIVLGALVVLVLVAAFALNLVARNALNKPYDVAAGAVSVPASDEAVARGEHFARAISGCAECHGPDLGGTVFIDAQPIGRVIASNLTAGAGGVGARYSDEDWVRAIRHGVRPDGSPLLPMMPSTQFSHLSDEDLGAIIAFVKSVPPVDSVLPDGGLSFTGQIIMGVLGAGDLPVAQIDHTAARPASMAPAVSAEYGEYLSWAGVCRDCHGNDLAGYQIDPSAPYAPNLTPGGELGNWSADDFIKLMRTGVGPDNVPISTAMPYEFFGNMTDDELNALWLFLQSVPAQASTGG
ncbi:MAG: cytochrome C [Chloroflexi bacterium]|nr:MAG: cytochrome C [Chloroflexota bacterium]